MRVLRLGGRAPGWARGAVAALGSFDGIHRGHGAVFDAARGLARAARRPFAVLTFEPHPRSVLRPGPPFRLSTFRSKIRALAALDVDLLVVVRFTPELAAKEPERFVDDVLVSGLGVSHVVTGYDFHFGKDRAGTPQLMAALGHAKGFGFTEVPVAGDGEEFSSTRIRADLRAGACEAAACVLGRWWEVEARVCHGAKRGRTLGYPTANLELRGMLAPARGIYAVWALEAGEDGPWRPAVASFGTRPTFGGAGDLLEVHLFDYCADLYRRYLRVRFVARIRDERKFDDVEALKREMDKDSAAARALLARNGPDGPRRAACPPESRR